MFQRGGKAPSPSQTAFSRRWGQATDCGAHIIGPRWWLGERRHGPVAPPDEIALCCEPRRTGFDGEPTCLVPCRSRLRTDPYVLELPSIERDERFGLLRHVGEDAMDDTVALMNRFADQLEVISRRGSARGSPPRS